MADNITIDTITGNPVCATDENGSGVHYQINKLAFGGEGAFTDVSASNPFPVTQENYFLEIAKGNIASHTAVNKFGRNPDVDNVFEDIWDGGGVWVPPTTARTHQIASTDADDTSAGAGAQTVEIFGLDAAFALQNETVSMNGVTDVPTANTYTMIHRMIVRTAGASEGNEGIITATADTDATVTAQMQTGNNQTLMAIYQIPASTVGYLWGYYVSNVGNSTNANSTAKLLVKPDGEVYQIKSLISLAGSKEEVVFRASPIVLAAKSIVKLQVNTDQVNTPVEGIFELTLDAS